MPFVLLREPEWSLLYKRKLGDSPYDVALYVAFHHVHPSLSECHNSHKLAENRVFRWSFTPHSVLSRVVLRLRTRAARWLVRCWQSQTESACEFAWSLWSSNHSFWLQYTSMYIEANAVYIPRSSDLATPRFRTIQFLSKLS